LTYLQDCTLPRGKKGLKAQKVKASWQKIKAYEQNLEMLRPGIPEKAIGGFSARNKRDP
jgi:hypothetical protein